MEKQERKMLKHKLLREYEGMPAAKRQKTDSQLSLPSVIDSVTMKIDEEWMSAPHMEKKEWQSDSKMEK